MQPTIYLLNEQGPSQMMGYIIQSSTGKLAVIDGGTKDDAQALLDTLIRLGGESPEIEFWLFTHPHTDHLDAMFEIFSHPHPLRVKKMYSCFMPVEFYIENKYEGDTCDFTAQNYLNFTAAHPGLCETFEKGMTLLMDDVSFHVLHTPDTSFTREVGNNTSVVFRMDAAGQRILFTGDLAAEAGDRVLETVPAEEIRADFVQMAHHGQNGVFKSFYEAVSPKACLWNTPVWLWNNDCGGGVNSGPWLTLEVRAWMDDLGIRHHFISKDGFQSISLPFDFG